MRKRQVVLLLLCFLFLLAGVGVLLYPSWHAWQEEQKIHQIVQSFRNRTQELAPQKPQFESESTEVTESTTPYPELLEAMRAYNRDIWIDGQSGLCDPWSYQTPVFDLAEYGVPDDTVGILTIPKVDLELPIYLGATAEHLASGAAQLSQTSMPIGGTNTNCVLAGHRGWYGALFFRHIELLEVGDEVTIQNLWETLTYQVVEIKVIEPNEIEEILVQPGRDMVTLLTCHPYGSGGRYRYVVYCERVGE